MIFMHCRMWFICSSFCFGVKLLDASNILMKNGLSLIVNSQATYFSAQHIYIIISRLLSNYLSGIPQSVFGLPSVVWDLIHNVEDSRMANEINFPSCRIWYCNRDALFRYVICGKKKKEKKLGEKVLSYVYLVYRNQEPCLQQQSPSLP